MKRFIRYLYEYEQGKRIRNVGFVKVESGDEETIVHMQGKGFHDRGDRTLVLYLFYEENGAIVGIWQAEVNLTTPVLSWNLHYLAENSNRIRGVLIETSSGRRIAATWDDQPIDVGRMRLMSENEAGRGNKSERISEAGRGTGSGAECGSGRESETGPEKQDAGVEARVEEEIDPLSQETEPEKQDVGAEARVEEEIGSADQPAGREEEEVGRSAPGIEEVRPATRTPGRKLTKIQRKDISRLPRCEWKLANNQFLMHGYNNYHHLLLIEEGNYLKLGVPGIYHIEEAKCADMFGFEEFLSAEELQIFPEDGEKEEFFGYWCRPVRRGRGAWMPRK